MSELKLSGNTYNADKVSNYILSILLSQNGLSFSIRDNLTNSFIHLEHLPEINCFQNFNSVKKVIREKLESKAKYREVHMVIDDPRVTVVPMPYAGEEANQRFFNLNYSRAADENLVSFYHDQMELTSVFPVREEIQKYFKSTFSELRILHICDAALWNALTYHNTTAGQFTVIVQKSSFYLIGVQNDKLLISTHFEYSSDDDFLFFLLNSFKQFEFSQYDTKIYLTGEIDSGSPLVEKLKKFVVQVEFESWPSYFNFSEEFFTVPAHRFFNLLIASNCE